MIGLGIVCLARRVVKACIELFSIMEDALELVSRECSVRKNHLPRKLTFQGVDRHHVVPIYPFEAPDIIYIIPDAFHALIEQFGILA